MSKAVKILGDKLKEKGFEGGEVAAMKLFEGLEEAMPAIVADQETSQTEKTIAAVLGPVVMGFKPSFQKLVDFDKDGQVG